MCTRPSTGLALVSLLAIGIAMTSGAGIARAFTEEKLQGSGLIAPSEIPSVHNTFYQVPEGVVGWDTLGNLDVRTEVVGPLRATFHTDYSKDIKALDGREVKLMGFIYPLEGGLEHSASCSPHGHQVARSACPRVPRRWSRCSARSRWNSPRAPS